MVLLFSLCTSALNLLILKKKGTRYCIYFLPPFITFQLTILVFIVARTGMAGVPGTAHAIFGAVKDVGANVIMISQVP